MRKNSFRNDVFIQQHGHHPASSPGFFARVSPDRLENESAIFFWADIARRWRDRRDGLQRRWRSQMQTTLKLTRLSQDDAYCNKDTHSVVRLLLLSLLASCSLCERGTSR
eukprot:scaffold24483_cov29-Prasinocladus_malaysianus.AAC.1